jgi:hypothetical protein
MRAVPAYAGPRVGVNLLGVIYLMVGGIVAATHEYWNDPDTAREIGSALLATLLWPLLLLGIDLHIR